MKRCPECGRDYNDDSLSYCLDDGSELLFGPGSGSTSEPSASAGGQFGDEPQTAILHETAPPGEAATVSQIHTTERTEVSSPVSDGRIGPRSRKSSKLIAALLGIAAVVAVGVFGYRYFVSSNEINSIAVLPFENKSDDPNADYLSDGLAESLIYRLSQLPNLKVSPTSSVMRYKGKGGNLDEIARELGVRAVMTGKVVQRGENLSISIELIDVANNKLLWGEQYEKKMADLLTTQREIATSIAGKLQLKLSGAETAGITKKYTNDNEAYQLYLRGRFQWNKRTVEGLRAAETFYKQAIERDPSFALAYSSLAETYVLYPNYSVESARESGPNAKAAATKAIELDPALAEPHAALGLYHSLYTWDLEASVNELRKASELNPKYATAFHWLGTVLPTTGKCDEAIAAARRAEELDPLSAIISADVAYDLVLCRRFDEAVAQTQNTLKLDPNFYYTHYVAGWAYSNLGDHAKAIASFRRSRELNSDPYATALFVQALAKAGERAEAVKLRDELRAEAKRQPIDPYILAIAEIGLGEKDAATALLEKTLTERGIYAPFIGHDPTVDGLRDDPRFAGLMKRIESSKLE